MRPLGGGGCGCNRCRGRATDGGRTTATAVVIASFIFGESCRGLSLSCDGRKEDSIADASNRSGYSGSLCWGPTRMYKKRMPLRSTCSSRLEGHHGGAAWQVIKSRGAFYLVYSTTKADFRDTLITLLYGSMASVGRSSASVGAVLARAQSFDPRPWGPGRRLRRLLPARRQRAACHRQATA